MLLAVDPRGMTRENPVMRILVNGKFRGSERMISIMPNPNRSSQSGIVPARYHKRFLLDWDAPSIKSRKIAVTGDGRDTND